MYLDGILKYCFQAHPCALAKREAFSHIPAGRGLLSAGGRAAVSRNRSVSGHLQPTESKHVCGLRGTGLAF